MNDWITRVAAKVAYHYNRQYCAYLTPAEIMNLHEMKFVALPPGHSNLDWIRANRDKGLSNPRWHYFLIKRGNQFEKAVLDRLDRVGRK